MTSWTGRRIPSILLLIVQYPDGKVHSFNGQHSNWIVAGYLFLGDLWLKFSLFFFFSQRRYSNFWCCVHAFCITKYNLILMWAFNDWTHSKWQWWHSHGITWHNKAREKPVIIIIVTIIYHHQGACIQSMDTFIIFQKLLVHSVLHWPGYCCRLQCSGASVHRCHTQNQIQ